MFWLTLFITIMIIFMLFNSLNYFKFTYPNMSNSLIKKSIKTSWKL